MKLTRNSWEAGRNTDANPSVIQPNQYTAGYNFELVAGGEYFAAQNLNGTAEVQTILNDDTVVELGTFPNRYLIDDVEYKCLTIFTATPNDKFKIWCYNTETTDLYELYEESIDSDYLTDNRIISARNYAENGVDFIYFTDFKNPIRFIKCQIDFPYSANFLTEYDLSLLRLGASGSIVLTSVSSGGSLLTGTYQFAYRCLDPFNKKFTKWSSLTNPIHVYDIGALTTDPVYAGIGLLSDRKIVISITPTDSELATYDYVQLAVLENVSEQQPTVASLLEVQPIVSSLFFTYSSNARIGTIPIEDLTVDLAEIETAKSIAIKENRLFLGNIKYAELEADNGTPEVTSGSIATYVNTSSSTSNLYDNPVTSSTKKGYFRGEVYRFGVLFRDKNGYGRIFPLDLTGKITGNQISGAPDMKFPSRETSSTYSLFDTNSRIKALGLNIAGLTNIPSWTRSVEIVRVERTGAYKDILFQTPLVPMASISGTGACGAYPTSYFNGSINDVPDAQPMTASSTLAPKNLFWPELRDIVQFGGNVGALALAQEVRLKRRNTYSEVAIFPQDSMYSSSPFSFTGSEVLDVVDHVALKCRVSSFTASNTPSGLPAFAEGVSIYTSLGATFHALSEDQYYFDATWSGKSISSSLKNITINDYEFFEALATEGKSLSGKSTLAFDDLRTKGIPFWQDVPSVPKIGAAKLGTSLSESSLVFKVGTLNAPGNNNYILGSSGIKYESSLVLSNTFVPSYASFNQSTSIVSSLPIANIRLGLQDTRYGDINAQHTYISTGSRYVLTNSDISTLQGGGDLSIDLEVWGGDCFITAHTFKVSDGAFIVTNETKLKTDNTSGTPINDSTYITRYKILYSSDSGGGASFDNLSAPIPVDNATQFVQVIIESEYNGEATDKDITSKITTVNNIPLMGVSSETSFRVPPTYRYNQNLNIDNEQKIYLPKLQYSFEQNEFKARIAYSDLKIYNSDQAGFDVIRVGNVYDLEESRYDIVKLALAGDNLYAIQETGVVYVPTGERQIEATDGGQLSVRSGDVIGRPLIINSERGSQHSKGIIETGDAVFIVDNIKRDVYIINGQQLEPITKDNETIFRSLLTDKIAERNIVAFYDPVRKDLYFNINGNCQVFNGGRWIGQYEFDPKNGVSQNGKMYLIGKPSTDLNVYTMHTGDVNNLFGTIVVPRIEFYINPDDSFSKTFEVFMADASQRLDEVDFLVQRESALGNQTVNGLSLDVLSQEGNFRVKAPRDANNSKLRGMRVKATVKWQDVISSFKYFWTKYTMSARTPF